MTGHVEYFYVCAECDWQLQYGDVSMLYLGPMRNEIIAFVREHEDEADHFAWYIKHVPWLRVHR